MKQLGWSFWCSPTHRIPPFLGADIASLMRAALTNSVSLFAARVLDEKVNNACIKNANTPILVMGNFLIILFPYSIVFKFISN